MSLSSNFEELENYLEECLVFLQDYQHLYNYYNIDILVDNVLDQIDIENFENVDVFEKSFDLKRFADKNEYMNTFFAKLDKLEVKYDDFTDRDLESEVDVPLSPKKRHEIVYLSKEIAGMCEKCGCDTVVDFGSGLGYLDQLLFETTDLKVLGLECNEKHYVAAKKRQRKHHENSIQNVKYVRHMVTEQSSTKIQQYLREKFDDDRGFCITGLHACADLTVHAINLFLKMADAKAIVLMPCCYHKMNFIDGKFANFPLSSYLKDLCGKYAVFEYFRVPLLRLAAQPPCRSDEKLQDAVFNLLTRAVLQLYASRYNCKLKRNKRKAVKTKSMDNNFSSFIQDATTNGYTLIHPENGSDSNNKMEFNLEALATIWRESSQKNTFKKAAIFVLLQNYMQPVIENFILYDRLVYMKEKGVEHCLYKKIFNEKLSPRCLALFAWK